MNNLTKNIILTPFNLLYKINPRLDLEILFRIKLGYKLNLDNPKTYNEKLQWIKLYDKNPLMPKCCDKYTVREYIKDAGYQSILNELIWQGFNPEDIPFEKLPNKFVVKVTHGSTFNIIVKDKNTITKAEIVKKCKKWLKAKFLPCYGEWFYGIERPRVIVEKFLDGDNNMPLFDYKFFCFNGKVKLIYVDTWKDGTHAINAYDPNFKLYKGVQLGFRNDDTTDAKAPTKLKEMEKIAEDLSKNFNHVRVDLYFTHGKIYFGELTFTKGAGFGKIKPYSFDEKMGGVAKASL